MTPIPVACGVLVDDAGRVLIAQRPAGKIAAGKWEFPGGKIEAGETAQQALVRELHEELGITVRRLRPLLRFVHHYADRSIALDVQIVRDYEGRPESREAQAFAWLAPESIAALDVLPTVAPILHALGLPPLYGFTAEVAQAGLQGLREDVPAGSLLRLRLPQIGDAEYAALAPGFIACARQRGLLPVLDRAPEQAVALGAAGWHASSAHLTRLAQRPLPASMWFLASAHHAEDLQRAHALGADAAVLGAVRATPTHPDARPLGWPAFAALAATAGLPVYALGGLGMEALVEARQRGAWGVAGIRGFWN